MTDATAVRVAIVNFPRDVFPIQFGMSHMLVHMSGCCCNIAMMCFRGVRCVWTLDSVTLRFGRFVPCGLNLRQLCQ